MLKKRKILGKGGSTKFKTGAKNLKMGGGSQKKYLRLVQNFHIVLSPIYVVVYNKKIYP